MKIQKLFVTALLAASLSCAPSETDQGVIGRPLRERARIRSELNLARVDRLLLPAMRAAGIDCWIIMSREFNKDFVLEYIEDNMENTPGGHRNAYIFFDDGSDRVRRILLGTHLPRGSQLWDEMISYHSGEGEQGPSLAPILRDKIQQLDPERIGIDQSRTIPMADGLTVEMKEFLVDAIGPRYASRLVSAEPLAVDFLDTRLTEEMQYFREAAELSKRIHWGVLDMITPGETTLGDMRWWIYEELAKLDIDTWYFHGLRIHRQGSERLDADSTVVLPGDVINNDIGVVYMGFHTDYKGTGYVLKPDETEAPAGIQQAFANALRVQDAVFEVARTGMPGHEVKTRSQALCEEWGIDCSVYSHSTGIAGHGIGAWMNPTWPDRYGVRSTFPLREGAVYALESHALTAVPEWGDQVLSINTEEDVVLTENGFSYVVPRQEEIRLISRNLP
jgi:Xaa-Pro aminopeptidase